MSCDVLLTKVAPTLIASVRRDLWPGEVAAAWRPALDQVWSFLARHPDLRGDGRNIFVYRRPDAPGRPMIAEFGATVVRTFAQSGEVHAASTPPGEVILTVHRDGPASLHLAAEALRHWAQINRRSLAGVSWEVYGHPDKTGAFDVTLVQLLV